VAWDDNLEGAGLEFAGSEAARLRALAGPGTGKTHSLLRRVARLLETGHRGTELLVVTFARTAAQDLVEKLRRLGEQEERYREVKARTLHSYCFAVLSSEGFLHASDRIPRIALEFERDFLLQDLEGEFDHTLTGRRDLTKAFEAAWARAQTDHPGQPVDGLDQSFQDALLATLRWHRAMLVGEVVPLTLAYLRQNPNAAERHGYSHVLVDEYQDLNKAEQVLIDLLSENADLAIIGDDDQSIYGFKHANPEGIREFDETHPGTEDVPFTECRRCPHRVVTLAQTLIQRNPGRIRGPLVARAGNPQGEIHNVQWRSIDEEADGIATFIQRKVQAGIDPGMCLVLANSRRIGYAIRDAVRARRIEIRSFFREQAVETEVAQERLTLLSLFATPDDRLALRSWLGLGSATALVGSYRAALRAAQQRGTSVAAVLQAVDAGEINVPRTAHALAKWRNLKAQLEPLEPFRDNLRAVVNMILPDTGVDPGEDDLALLRRTAISCIDEAESLAELPDLIRYRIGQPEVPLETPYARVMSFHKSKGLTADLVVLAGLVDGLMPRVKENATEEERRAQIEEQRRVFFVGMTRTTRILVFSSYSQLPSEIAHNLRARRGRYIPRDQAYATFATPFLEETGPTLPRALRGGDWLAALGNM
jgi:superfamily I DNA/RNA helicase